MVASSPDLAQGERRGPEAGHGAGAGNSSARGCRCTKGEEGEVAAKNNRDAACWENIENYFTCGLSLNGVSPTQCVVGTIGLAHKSTLCITRRNFF